MGKPSGEQQVRIALSEVLKMITDVNPIQASESAGSPHPSRSRDRFSLGHRPQGGKSMAARGRTKPRGVEERLEVCNSRPEARTLAWTQPESSRPLRGIQAGDDFVLRLYLRDLATDAAEPPERH